MNYSKDGLRISHHEQKYFCSFCNFRTHKKYNLEMHKKNKHGTSQAESGALLAEQNVPHHVQQENFNQHLVPIETYNHAFRQWQGWTAAYKNIEARNKQLEAWREEDSNLLQQADQEVSVLKSQLQGLLNEKDQLKESYKQKFKSSKYKKFPYL